MSDDAERDDDGSEGGAANEGGGVQDGAEGARDKPTRAALKRELRRLSREFADEIVALLDSHGVWDDAKPEKTTPSDEEKRLRRSADTLSKVKARILAELRTRREPVAIGSVAATLGLSSRQITHPMSLLVDEGLVLRTGIRRGARYAVAPKSRKPARKKRKTRRRQP